MKGVLRGSVEDFLRAEGRLELLKLGPGKERPARSDKAATILKKTLHQARQALARRQRIYGTLLSLVVATQVLLAAYGVVTSDAPVVLASVAGLLSLSIFWILRRFGSERLFMELLSSLLDLLPSWQIGKVIEIIYWGFIAEGSGKPPPALHEEPSIPILFVASHPSEMAHLRLDKEAREIQKKLQSAKLRHRFVLHQWPAATPDDLVQALLDTQPEIVHFSGHGSEEGALFFEQESGETVPVEPPALSALFREFPDVRCVLLNACYGELQARAIGEHIEYVIGARKEIEDEDAIAFAIGFYRALGAGRSIEEAYRLGCVEAGFQGLPEEAAPVLLHKS